MERSLVELAWRRAAQEPDRVAYTFLSSDAEHSYTYCDVDRRARLIGAAVRARCHSGDRVVIMLPPGLGYVAAFFGCMYAGAVAVPVYPPRAAGVARGLSRLQAVLVDARPRAALALGEISDRAGVLAESCPGLDELDWITVDALDERTVPAWQPEPVAPEQLAFLQYTSGSTALPKGVMVSHANLMHNGADIERLFGLTPASKTVIWLPPYHDMGLIGGILQPLFTGYPTVLMPPTDFARRPVRWLRAISEHRATVSGGPNFGYELCADRIRPEEIDGLDLSCWELAFNGAEPIRAGVMERFADLLAGTGFRHSVFYPCYGLAEATLIVSGGDPKQPPVLWADETAAPGAGQLVGCGQPAPGQRVAIVDPVTRTELPDGDTGEIWVAGSSVALGYYGRPEETAATFEAHLADTGEGPFLRTGDLGIHCSAELYIAGRIKDLIIQRGVNHYPQDIERTATRAHPALRPNSGASFTVLVCGAERLVVAHEVVANRRDVDLDAVMAGIRRAVAREHLLSVHAVILVRAGRLPRTSSGKIERYAAKQAYLSDRLDALASWAIERDLVALGGQRRGSAAGPASDGLVNSAAAPDRPALVAALLRAQVASRTGTSEELVDLDLSGPALGLDSLALLELQHVVEAAAGVELSPEDFHGQSLSSIADQVVAAMSARVATPAPAGTDRGGRPSEGQRAMWYLDRLTGSGAAYNLSGAVRLPDDLDTDALARAVDALVERHAALRTCFTAPDGDPVRVVSDRGTVALEPMALPDRSPEALRRGLAAAAGLPFDLERGPLLRILLHLSPGSAAVLQLVVHHIVSDFWSLALLLAELAEHYRAETTGISSALPHAGDYSDFVRWQQDFLDSVPGRASAAYWAHQLGGELPVLDLPTDRPRPSTPRYRGGSRPFAVDSATARQLGALARTAGTTMHTVLLAAFDVLLHRYSGQPDVLVGVPTSGRSRARFAATVGYLVNPVVVRADLRGNPSFTELVGQVTRSVSDALAHQDYPFGKLIEALAPARDPGRSAVFQAMFLYHRSPLDLPPALGLVAVGQDGQACDLAGLRVEPLAVPLPTAQFDLTLAMTGIDDQLAGSFQYDSDLFDAGTVDGMAEAFLAVLRAIVADPGQPVGALPLLSDQTRDRMLRSWNDTARALPGQQCVHHCIEAMATRFPERVALVFRDVQLTYRELDEQANHLAGRLAALGIAAEARVGLCVDRSPELVVALLGILKAGAAYVPLDPGYPRDRLELVATDAQVDAVVTRNRLLDRLPPTGATVVDLDERDTAPDTAAPGPMRPENAAYVLYTSGSTGAPKGVVVSHRNVINFFAGMDDRVGCGPDDNLLAITSVAFDISVLELLWTLSRGARVLLVEDDVLGRTSRRSGSPAASRPLEFSLFFFASAARSATPARSRDRYRLVLDGARFADRNGFTAVWTPERHFHEFGGLYPNPSVLSAALATITERVRLRAGSVVAPLHSPIRIAEEWALVDNLSGGRVDIAFASGWHADDFVFSPERYADRRERLADDIATVQMLWRGEAVTRIGGSGTDVRVRIHPAPVQPTLPTWVTSGGSADTFVRAGAIGANVLTHLLGQDIRQVASNIRRYREARAAHGHDPDAGTVTLMLHTFLGADVDGVRTLVRRPFTEYLRSSVGLIESLVRSLGLPLDLAALSESDMNDLLDFAFDRYFNTSALFGTPESVRPLLGQLAQAGVNEVACLIDFGLPDDDVLTGLPNLATLRDTVERAGPVPASPGFSLAEQIRTHQPTLLQATPSTMRLVAHDRDAMAGLRSLRALLLGGEPLLPALASSLGEALPATVLNMYGPTETTVWSATHRIGEIGDTVPLGEPISNTELYVVDPAMRPVPIGVPGELLIGGQGVSRGYWRRPGRTAEAFVPDPFGNRPGTRLYRTGDLARRRADGTLEFLGRLDRQVKVRGMRIELGDIEAALRRHGDVAEAVVVARGGPADVRLTAYHVPVAGAAPSLSELLRWLRELLPSNMVPADVVALPRIPLTANGKIDFRALPAPEPVGATGPAPPSTDLERRIAAIWGEVLQLDTVGRYDNFFDLGGHSLLMVQVHSRLVRLIGGELPLITLLEYPTVSALAHYLGQEHTVPVSFQASEDRARHQRAHRGGRATSGRSLV